MKRCPVCGADGACHLLRPDGSIREGVYRIHPHLSRAVKIGVTLPPTVDLDEECAHELQVVVAKAKRPYPLWIPKEL